MKDYAIIVLGHTRPEHLQFVLEGLSRQGALADSQVWLDGHHGLQELLRQVEACQALENSYSAAQWFKFRSRRGLVKLFLDAFALNSPRHQRFVILEDDCFPTVGAIETMISSLKAVENDPEIFSVYGHHYGTANEGLETTAFQGWGWASTREKLAPVVDELRELWDMPELEAFAKFERDLTPEICARMDLFPGRANSKFLGQLFSFDTVLAFLVAKHGLRNRRTPSQVIFNFGIAYGAGHFPSFKEALLEPPFNMLTKEMLVDRFGLQGLPDEKELLRRGRAWAETNRH